MQCEGATRSFALFHVPRSPSKLRRIVSLCECASEHLTRVTLSRRTVSPSQASFARRLLLLTGLGASPRPYRSIFWGARLPLSETAILNDARAGHIERSAKRDREKIVKEIFRRAGLAEHDGSDRPVHVEGLVGRAQGARVRRGENGGIGERIKAESRGEEPERRLFLKNPRRPTSPAT